MSVHAMELEDATKLKKAAVFASHKLGNIDLYHSKKGFTVSKDNKNHDVKPYFVEKTLRSLNKKQLDALQKHGYIEVNQMNDGEYSLKMKMRGKGGGPALAQFAFWMTRAIGYGVPATLAVTTAVAAIPVVTGTGVAAGASAGTAYTAKFLGGVGLKTLLSGTTVTAPTVASTFGTGLVANTLIGTVGVEAATQATVTAVAASTASSGGYIGFVEGLACTAWAFCLALPTL